MASGERVSLFPHIMETERGVANVVPSNGGKSEGEGTDILSVRRRELAPSAALIMVPTPL